VLGLLARAIDEPYDREPGNAALNVHFDLDPEWLEADESVGHGAREHATDATWARRTSPSRLRAGSVPFSSGYPFVQMAYTVNVLS
jgi:hypothetical protein